MGVCTREWNQDANLSPYITKHNYKSSKKRYLEFEPIVNTNWNESRVHCAWAPSYRKEGGSLLLVAILVILILIMNIRSTAFITLASVVTIRHVHQDGFLPQPPARYLGASCSGQGRRSERIRAETASNLFLINIYYIFVN